jgi:hypothetical protein
MTRTPELKYTKLLSEIKNCPSDNFVSIDKIAFRWVHQNPDESDFLPINLIKEPPQRVLDNTDLLCMGYGLSFFNTKENARQKFLNLYERLRTPLQKGFLEEKGNFIAEINLEKSDGLSDAPSEHNYGHFTFFEFMETKLTTKINSIDLILK